MQPWKILVRSHLSGAWHYRWTAIVVAWLFCAVAWGAFAVVPNQFQAISKIYIDTDTMMGPLLAGLTVTTDPEQQVAVMLNTLLTRPNLEQVVRLTSPIGGTISSADMARQVQDLQNHVSLKFLGTKNLYELAFSDKDPNRALLVSQTLISIFVDSNIGTKRRDFQGVRSFLDDKVAEYETLVRDAEQRRAAFRQANLDVLSNNVTPDAARAAVEKAKEEVGAAQARLSSLEAQLRTIPKVIYLDGPGPIIVSSGTANSASIGSGGSLFQRLSEAKQSLLELQSKYTDDYPDVKAAKRQVEQLQGELAATPPVGAEGRGNQSISNPIYVQTQSKMSDAMTDVAYQTQRYNDALAAFQNAKNMTSQEIEINTKFADLDRDYDLVHKTYQDLISRREAARISQAVNDQQSNINVRVVEPPKKAPYPSAPNRPLINSIILLAGLTIGLVSALALSWNAGRFFVKDQLTAEFDYPVIGVVTRLERAGAASNTRRSVAMLATSLVVLFCSYLGVLVVFDSTFRGMVRGFL
jgi:polysaccharide chain length determinant protein (PEP-CTERM system associated)